MLKSKGPEGPSGPEINFTLLNAAWEDEAGRLFSGTLLLVIITGNVMKSESLGVVSHSPCGVCACSDAGRLLVDAGGSRGWGGGASELGGLVTGGRW